jgi:hypothetical protein
MYTHPFFEATPPGAAPGPPVNTGARVRHFRGCKKMFLGILEDRPVPPSRAPFVFHRQRRRNLGVWGFPVLANFEFPLTVGTF